MKRRRDPDTPDLFPDSLREKLAFIKKDRGASLRAKREGMARALANEHEEWKRGVVMYVAKLPSGWEGKWEDIRVQYTIEGKPQPHTPHCWGGMCNSCIKMGLLEWIGIHRQMEVISSHGRESKVYRRTGGGEILSRHLPVKIAGGAVAQPAV